MRVKCNIDYCKHWKENAGPYIGTGGCTLEEITISDEELTAAGYIPKCEDFEEREERHEDSRRL